MPNFTVDEKMRIVILGFDPRANIEGICKKYEITLSEFRDWKMRFLEGARTALQKPGKHRDTQEIRKNLERTRMRLKEFIGGSPSDSETP